MTARNATLKRTTLETSIELSLNLDGTGKSDITTGIGFLDHLLTALTKHGNMDLTLSCRGDLDVDDHHTAEDCALALGSAIDRALGDRSGIARFGSAYAPLDEALARAVVDLSGRPCAVINLGLAGPKLGALATQNAGHVIQSLAVASRATIHVDVVRGENDHHRAESAFKALALALRQAIALSNTDNIPSTKGSL
ncbi:MAG: imidazoleglycerol-phosphate dehydratase HisB [Myxococcota bacterium]|nr:imidazoleglycerol-phosphate dehydratase HisB [Myxococcota bacterium]